MKFNFALIITWNNNIVPQLNLPDKVYSGESRFYTCSLHSGLSLSFRKSLYFFFVLFFLL